MKAQYLWIVAVIMGVITVPASVFAKPSAAAPLSAVERSTAWLNSEPLSAADLRGKVVLVDFWTYTCINWRRTLPWLRAWDERYRKSGLVVLGIHTPEFSFEKDVDNVRLVSREQHVDYPIAIDSNHTIWNAFRNQYWPALYIVDAQGRIRHEQFGEGDYDWLDALIQQLLSEAGHPAERIDSAQVRGSDAEAAADWKSLQSAETYLGYARAESFASPGGALRDRERVYTSPSSLRLNTWALTGYWTVNEEFAVSHKSNGRVAYRFHARDELDGAGVGAGGERLDDLSSSADSRLVRLRRTSHHGASRSLSARYRRPGNRMRQPPRKVPLW